MFTVELMGGLGNQLFQIITLMSYSKKCNQPFVIKKVKSLSGQYVTRDVYWDTLFKSLKDNLVDDPRTDKYQIVMEKGFNYEELPMRTTDTKLHGYFQSYKYFEEHGREIFDFLKFDEYKKSVAKSYDNKQDFISLHFRVGDYVKLQHAHPLMSCTYYCNAIEHIITQTKKDDWTIVYFCEENDIKYVMDKINKIQKRFPKITFIKVNSNLTDWEQMLLMSQSNHNIIANSSFSWWGAYLNNNENKIVCYPNKWFGAVMKQNHNTKDLFPPTWTECSAYDLSNVYYINLIERPDRRVAVEDELYKLNWKYQRFNAIKVNDGRVGCSMSHYKLLEMAKKNDMEYIVIVEDDIMFTKPEQYAEMLEGFIRSNMEYDVLLLAGNLRPPFTKINDNLLKITKAWTTTGYIVKKHYYEKLMANIKEGITKLMANPEQHHLYAIDAYWQKLQETDNWFILMPRTVTQRPNYSTIEKRFTDYNRLMLD